jgi:hypothetical protein
VQGAHGLQSNEHSISLSLNAVADAKAQVLISTGADIAIVPTVNPDAL